jgi:predicted ester cyclase
MSDRNKALVHRWVDDLWHRFDFSDATAFVAEDLRFRSNQVPPANGLSALQATIAGIRAGFPDGRFTIDELVAEGDTVVQRWTFRGTHQGEWAGKIAEHSADWDALLMMQQLGAVKG